MRDSGKTAGQQTLQHPHDLRTHPNSPAQSLQYHEHRKAQFHPTCVLAIFNSFHAEYAVHWCKYDVKQNPCKRQVSTRLLLKEEQSCPPNPPPPTHTFSRLLPRLHNARKHAPSLSRLVSSRTGGTVARYTQAAACLGAGPQSCGKTFEVIEGSSDID